MVAGVKSVLLVEDDPLVRAATERALRNYASIYCASTFDEGVELLFARTDWAALFLDINLGEGDARDGFALLAKARISFPNVPAVMVTGEADRAAIYRAFELGAMFLPKPFQTTMLISYLKNLVHDTAGSIERITAAVDDVFGAYDLTDRERRILLSASLGEARNVFSTRHGIAEGTYKNHVSSILTKTRYETLFDLVVFVLHRALG